MEARKHNQFGEISDFSEDGNWSVTLSLDIGLADVAACFRSLSQVDSFVSA